MSIQRAAIILYMAPVAIWGASTAESALGCALRALHTLVALNHQSRDYRWKQTQIHGMNAWGSGLMTLISLVPVIGTFKSYEAIALMIFNQIYNTWRVRELQKRVNAKAADTLYRELLAWEPDIDRLMMYTAQAVPTEQQIDAVATELKASLVGRSFVYSGLFHLIEGSCRAITIIAIRVARLISARPFIKMMRAIGKGVKQEIQYVRNLIDQPLLKPLPELYFEVMEYVLATCPTPEEKEKLRLQLAKQPSFRTYVTSNNLSSLRNDGPFPEGAPAYYFHMLRELPAASAHYSKLKAAGKKVFLYNFLRYFNPILPYINRLKREWLERMTPEARKEWLWALSKQLPNLQEAHLDMAGIDPRWQILIGAQLAKHAPRLRSVTLIHSDHRVAHILRIKSIAVK